MPADIARFQVTIFRYALLSSISWVWYSPRAKEQATGLNIFSLFKSFPRVPEMGQEIYRLGQRIPRHQAFSTSLCCFSLSDMVISKSTESTKCHDTFFQNVQKHLWPFSFDTSRNVAPFKTHPSIIQQSSIIKSAPTKTRHLKTSQRQVGIFPLRQLSILQLNLALL